MAQTSVDIYNTVREGFSRRRASRASSKAQELANMQTEKDNAAGGLADTRREVEIEQLKLQKQQLALQKSVQDELLKNPNYQKNQVNQQLLDSKLALDQSVAQDVFNRTALFKSQLNQYAEGSPEQEAFIRETAHAIDMADDGKATPGFDDLPIEQMAMFIREADQVAVASVASHQAMAQETHKQAQMAAGNQATAMVTGQQARATAELKQELKNQEVTHTIHNAVDASGSVVGQIRQQTNAAGGTETTWSPDGVTWYKGNGGHSLGSAISLSGSEAGASSGMGDAYSTEYTEAASATREYGRVSKQISNVRTKIATGDMALDSPSAIRSTWEGLKDLRGDLVDGIDPESMQIFEEALSSQALELAASYEKKKLSGNMKRGADGGVIGASQAEREAYMKAAIVNTLVDTAQTMSVHGGGGKNFAGIFKAITDSVGADGLWPKDESEVVAALGAIEQTMRSQEEASLFKLKDSGAGFVGQFVGSMIQEGTVSGRDVYRYHQRGLLTGEDLSRYPGIRAVVEDFENPPNKSEEPETSGWGPVTVQGDE